MALSQEIAWGDGSGDKIYISGNASEGNQTLSISSDANSGAARTKTITFTSGVGNITQTLTVSQEAGVVQHTLTVLLSSFIPKATDGDWYGNLTNTSNAYLDPTTNSSSMCGVGMARGAGADTWIYFKFDTSSLPANATIVSVSCQARPGISSNNSNYVAVKGCVMCSGTTVKTESISVNYNAYLNSFDTGTWTRAELNDVRIKLYGTRGSTNPNNSYVLRMYGAKLTIVYTE